MGISAGLTEITPEALEQMLAGGSPDTSESEYHSLDRTWFEIHEALQPAGHPLDKAITGDRLHPDAAHSFEEFREGEHDYYVGLMSPQLVRELAAALSKCNPLDEGQPQEQSEFSYAGYVGGYFRELTKAYREAASRGNALMIMIF